MTTVTDTVLEHEIGPTGLFALHLRIGELRLRAVEGGTVRVRADDAETLESIVADRGPDSLSLRSTGHPPDLVIDVPTRASVVIDVTSADVDVDGLLGEQRYRSASGALDLRGVGGRITAESMSGDITIEAHGDGEFDLRAVSGDVALRAATIRRLRATTTSGDLRVAGRFEPDGTYAVETVSGDATIAAAGDIRIDVRTIAGSVRSDRPSHIEDVEGRRVLVVGRGGPTIAFRSTSGDLRVVEAGTLRTLPAIPAPPIPPMPPVAPSAPVAPTAATPDDTPPVTDDDPSLAILRDLEAGTIDIDEARRRLEAIDAEPTDG